MRPLFFLPVRRDHRKAAGVYCYNAAAIPYIPVLPFFLKDGILVRYLYAAPLNDVRVCELSDVLSF